MASGFEDDDYLMTYDQIGGVPFHTNRCYAISVKEFLGLPIPRCVYKTTTGSLVIWLEKNLEHNVYIFTFSLKSNKPSGIVFTNITELIQFMKWFKVKSNRSWRIVLSGALSDDDLKGLSICGVVPALQVEKDLHMRSYWRTITEGKKDIAACSQTA